MMLRILALAAAMSTTAVTASASTELLTNGGFETGDFTGWTATVFPSSNGDVQVVNGATAPVSGFTATGPSEGTWHTMTGQSGPGAYSVMQTFTVPTAIASLELTFDMFAVTNVAFADNGLDPFAGNSTQHARVDILAAGSGAFDLGASVVHTVLNPFLDGPFSGAAYSSYSEDLLGILAPGVSYELRFAQTDNQGQFSMGVDNVSLVAAAIPLPAALPLLLAALGGLGVLRARRT